MVLDHIGHAGLYRVLGPLFARAFDYLETFDPATPDGQFFHGTDDRQLRLAPGDFTVFWPHDGHKPACLPGTPCQVRKVVAKVRVA